MAELQERLRAQEARMAGALILEQRLIAAEAVIAQQQQQLNLSAAQQARTSLAGSQVGDDEPRKQSFIDTRAIGKPPNFSGEVGDDGKPDGPAWSQWAFLFRAYVGAFSADTRKLLEDAEQAIETIIQDPHFNKAEYELGAQVYYILALTLRGRALGVVQRTSEGNGFEAWRLLCAEFEPRLPGIFQSMLQALLAPPPTRDPVQCLYEWERRVDIYENQSGDTLSDPIKRAVVTSHLSSGPLRAHLNLQAARLNTYREVRDEALSYLRVLRQAGALDDNV